jgi:hypothetical protein
MIFCRNEMPIFRGLTWLAKNDESLCIQGRVTSLGEFSIVYLGKFSESYRSSPHFCAIFLLSIDYVLILTKNSLGYILSDFFHKLIWSPWSRVCPIRWVLRSSIEPGETGSEPCFIQTSGLRNPIIATLFKLKLKVCTNDDFWLLQKGSFFTAIFSRCHIGSIISDAASLTGREETLESLSHFGRHTQSTNFCQADWFSKCLDGTSFVRVGTVWHRIGRSILQLHHKKFIPQVSSIE